MIPSGVVGSSDYVDGPGLFHKFFRYNIAPTSFSFSSDIDPSGNIIYAVKMSSIFINKVSSSGKVIWKKALSSTVELVNQIITDSSGNIYVFGRYTPSFQYKTGIVIKLDSSGNILWQKQVNSGSSSTYAAHSAAIVAPSGNIYVSFFWLSNALVNPSTNYAMLTKLDSSGNHTWSRYFYVSTYANDVYGLGLDSSENIYMQSTHAGSPARVLSKFNSSGSVLWNKINTNTAMNLTTDSSGNSYMAREGTSATEAFTKIDANGSRVFLVTSSAVHNFTNVALDSSGNIYLAGTTNGNSKSVEIVKFNSSGSTLWQKTITSTSFPDTVYPKIYVKNDIPYLSIFGTATNPQMIVSKLSATTAIPNGTYKVENVVIVVSSGSKTYGTNNSVVALSNYSATINSPTYSMTNTSFSISDSSEGEIYNRTFQL